MHNFKELKIWQKSMELVNSVYHITRNFPKKEKFGLVSQIRRAAVSIPSNIAEGSVRGTNKDFARFLSFSFSSAYELETQLILSNDLAYIENKSFESVINEIIEIQKMIFGFKNKLKT